MRIQSVLPPTSFQSVLNGQWYIVTTDPKLGWVEVDRKYSWEELNKMWEKPTSKFKNTPKEVVKLPKSTPKQTFSVEGSKGKVYEILNDGGKWSCSCPAFGFSRGNGCKHITQIKNNP
jgi:hypothetical protein